MPTTKFPSAATSQRLKYDPADFIIPAHDTKGHSERLWFRCQPGHDRMADVIVGSKRFPFRTKGDLIRWCLHVGLAKLEALEGGPSVNHQVDAIMVVVRDSMFQQEFQAMFESLQAAVNQHMVAGADGAARRLIAQVRAHIERMPKDDDWRERYLKELSGKFGHMLKGSGGRRHHEEEDQEADEPRRPRPAAPGRTSLSKFKDEDGE